MSKIQVHRGLESTVQLPLQSATFTKVLQGEHSLAFSLNSFRKLDLRIGDTLTYKGELMTINKEPAFAKMSSIEWQTDVQFQGLRHNLERYLLKDEGAISFDYFGTLEDFMFMFLESANDSDAGWSFGELETGTDPKAISFDRTYLWDGLVMIAQAFECEWQIVGKVISIKKTVGNATAITLAYGKDNGLFSLSREGWENGKIINKVFGIGGDQNLPDGYTKKVLQLDEPISDEDSIAIYGVREGSYSNEDIFPKRTSTATDARQYNEGTFILQDTTIDFDLERIDGVEAKIVFKSGALNGKEFKILSYNSTTKEIRYEANKDSNGLLLPRGVIVAETGDQYTLVGIRQPQEYVDDALLELAEKAEAFLNDNKIPRVVYTLDIDILDAKRKNTYPTEGDFIHVIDTELGIDDDLRVTSISYPALFPDVLVEGMKFNCEVGNDVTYTLIQKIVNDIKETREVVTQVSRKSWENDRRNAIAVAEFRSMVLDPDGNLEHPMMEALVAYFGTPSQLFTLNPTPTFTMGEEEFTLTATELVHKVYEVAGLGYIWDLPAFSQDGLDPDKAYYLAARCSKTVLTGEWVLTETIQETESEVGYWHFNLGILSSVIEGSRSFRATKGFTLVSGGQIETDLITAYMINVVRLFAQYIEATDLHVRGSSTLGPFNIDENGLYYSPGSSIDYTGLRVNKTGITWTSQQGFPNPVPRSAFMRIGDETPAVVDILNEGNANKHTGIRINMESDPDHVALDILGGKIKVGDFFGYTGSQPIETGTGIKYLRINKGIITSIANTE